MRVLSKHYKHALYMCLNVPVKKEPGNSGSSEKPPKPKDDAATSLIMMRLLGFQLDPDMGHEDSGLAELQGMSELAELQGRMHAVYPGEAATKLETRKRNFGWYENILEDIEAIPVENFVVTLTDYERCTVKCAVVHPHPQCTGAGAAHSEHCHP